MFLKNMTGHEDLRQDERVMQLFALINTLLAGDRETANRQMSIQRYAIIPLSPHSGLIGWVPNHDTLHALIANYRSTREEPVPINIEHRHMLQMASEGNKPASGEAYTFLELIGNFEKLCVLQKVEIFEAALEKTAGDDLDKVLWLKSPNSEVWLDRRTNYTRSLAVMSMAGYILGLGDRHPSNIMLDRHTGKITHIDFGDCFEVNLSQYNFHLQQFVVFTLCRLYFSSFVN
jgi:FKBP12-rapamycin complex-associated protein